MTGKDVAVSVKGLYKDFLLPHDRKNSIKETILHFRKPEYEHLHALHDINFEVKRGEFFGIVGRNGSGKSTLLKILGGIYQPTKGQVHINGTLTPFIELGIGFNPELTGKENVFLNGAILGISRGEVKKLYPKIVEFSELEKFMDQKLKNYSSGMQVRLAFSIAIQAHNDILLIDEVLAVGDASFQRKCFKVFKEIKASGRTVIFVTHDMGAVQEYCDRAMLINDSRVVEIGRSDKIASLYTELNYEGLSSTETDQANRAKKPRNTKAQITRVITKHQNTETQRFKVNQAVTVLFKIDIKQDIKSPVTGITVKDMTGKPMFATNTRNQKQELPDYKKGDKLTIAVTFENPLNEGTYMVEPAIASSDLLEVYDNIVDGCVFHVTNSDFPFGIIYPTVTIEYNKD